jgi:GxxExxY protein
MSDMANTQVVYADEVYRIQGAIFEVNRQMGTGFLEAVYQQCLEIEFAERQIPFVAMQTLGLRYKGVPLRATYQPDFICYGRIIVELKAVGDLGPAHKAQVKNYLKATGLRLGLLVNFNHYPKADITRVAL